MVTLPVPATKWEWAWAWPMVTSWSRHPGDHSLAAVGEPHVPNAPVPAHIAMGDRVQPGAETAGCIHGQGSPPLLWGGRDDTGRGSARRAGRSGWSAWRRVPRPIPSTRLIYSISLYSIASAVTTSPESVAPAPAEDQDAVTGSESTALSAQIRGQADCRLRCHICMMTRQFPPELGIFREPPGHPVEVGNRLHRHSNVSRLPLPAVSGQ